jgi:tetraacyldisaccharide 4'-kinase
MREPGFWWEHDRGRFLSPLAAVYGAVAWARMRGEGRQAGVPVICLGNLTVGGAGKTPAALAVARVLLAAHERPFFLSRGYGGRLAGPVRVNPSLHGAAEVGDEPLLLTRLAPTIVARDRVAGARAAHVSGASVIVMDDGFQNPSLAKDLAFVLVDGSRGIGNGRIIPAGPLRAPLRAQVARADALIVVGAPERAAAVIKVAQQLGKPVLHGRLEPDRACLAALGGRPVLAFAGIGNPDKFFTTLTAAGVTIGQRVSFPDHHPYNAAEARTLLSLAESANLVLLTTEKDLARISSDRELAALSSRATALPVRLLIDEQDVFGKMVLDALKPD